MISKIKSVKPQKEYIDLPSDAIYEYDKEI